MRVAELAVSKPRIISSQPRLHSSLPASRPQSSQRVPPPPFPASLPTSLTVKQRAEQSQAFAQDRLRKSAALNGFMIKTQGKCGRCFVTSGTLLSHTAFSECPDDGIVIPRDWISSYKSLFNFEQFAYCWNCGTPQDRRGNKESPDCHRKYTFVKGQHCPWADFIYIVSWSLWHHPVHRPAFLQEFGLRLDTDFDRFSEWVVLEDHLGGKYYNGLELYLWYTQVWLKGGRRVQLRLPK